MKVICSYCRKIINNCETAGASVSHSMCTTCSDNFRKEWHGLSLGEYLDRFEFPVLVLTETCRIFAANQAMAEMIGRPERELQGLLGGEGVECIYSRLEKGCGNEVHCRTCTVRNSVLHTLETGETLHRVMCYVERDGGRQPFYVSTVKLDRSVQVAFEPAVGDIGPA